MSRVLGIDHGDKKIGLAVSDKSRIIATPIDYIFNDDNLIENLKKLINEYEIAEFVIGLPLMLSGEESIQTEKVRDFKDFIENELQIEMNFLDERLTTSYAEKLLISGNMKRKKRKEKIDSLSAQIILQNYLDKTQK